LNLDTILGGTFFAACIGAIFWRLSFDIRKSIHPARSAALWLGITVGMMTLAIAAVGAIGVLLLVGLHSVGLDLGKPGIATVIGGALGAAAATWSICERRMKKAPGQ
jgi:hypothetical protein